MTNKAIQNFSKELDNYFSKSRLRKAQAHTQFVHYAFYNLVVFLHYTPIIKTIKGHRIPDFQSLHNSFTELSEKHPQEFFYLNRAYAAYCIAVTESEPYTDIFSNTYMSSQASVSLAQHFTPWDLCLLCAELQLNHRGFSERQKAIDDLKSKPEVFDLQLPTVEVFELSDICVGAGAMPLAILQLINRRYPEQLRYTHLMINDIDEECVLMAILQIVMPMYFCEKDIVPLRKLDVYRSNAITEYSADNTRLFEITTYSDSRINFYIPKNLVPDEDSIELLKAFEPELQAA